MAHRATPTKRLQIAQATTLADDIARFLDYCRANNLSPKTVDRHYGWSLHKILEPFAAERGITYSTQLTQPVLEELARTVHARQNLSVASRRTYLRGINQFTGWLDKNGPKTPLPKLKKIDRDVLSPQEMRALAAASPYQRDRLIIELMAQTGMREGEVASINVGDLTERDRVPHVHVRGKTGERYVPVKQELMRGLRRLADGHREGLTTKRLFLSIRAATKGGAPRPLSGNAIYQVVKQAAARLDWERRIYPHLLRHSAISRMVAKGIHPSDIAAICGVSSAVIAAHYAHTSFRQRYDALMRSLEED